MLMFKQSREIFFYMFHNIGVLYPASGVQLAVGGGDSEFKVN